MKAVVLAAGQGTRLRPLTDDRPKALVDVAGDPILTHCLEELAALQVDEAVVVVGYRADDIIERYGDTFDGLPLTYASQDEPLGSAHALLAAREHISGPFVLTFGDYLFELPSDLEQVLRRYHAEDTTATLLAEEVTPEAATDYGVCRFDADGDLVGLTEKPDTPASNVVITGFFVFSPVIFPACEVLTPSDRGEYELTAAIDLLVHARHDIDLVHAEGWLRNINTPEDRQAAERLLA